MRKYLDDKNNILWVDYFNNENMPKSNRFLDYFRNKSAKHTIQLDKSIPSTIDALNELDHWTKHTNSEGIKKYILIGKENTSLGKFLYSKYIDPNREIRPEQEDKQFSLYIAYNNETKKAMGTALLSHCVGYKALYPDYLEYIVVSPEMQRQGIGTQMMESMANNFEFFTSDHLSKSLATYVKKDNLSSKALFRGLGFRKFENPYIEGMEDEPTSSNYIALVHDNFAMGLSKNTRARTK